MKAIAKELLLGVAVGDALGVPFEFLSRERMALSPAKDMVGHGTHNQLPGTWSDDSSLTFCLAEAMVKDYGLVHTAENFVKWRNKGYWTARNSVFDIGMTTTDAISDLYDLLEQKRYRDLRLLKYQAEEYDNGNGSLMRILPLVFETMGKPIKAQFELVWDNSSLTHRHIRAGMSCMIYLRFAEHLIAGLDKTAAYQKTREDILQLWKEIEFADREQGHFKRVIQTDISTYEEDTILSGGYVIYILGGPHNGIIAICRFWDANRPNLMWCKLHAKPATTWIIILQLFINLHTTLNNLFFHSIFNLFYFSEISQKF